MVNRGVREALDKSLTARGSLVPFAQLLARELHLNFAHARTATDTALSLDKGHRRRLRSGCGGQVPYILRPFLIADDSTFHLDPVTGHVRLSVRSGEWIGLELRLSDWHRSVLKTRKIKQLRVNLHHAVLVLEHEVPDPYPARTLLALDTNERSLDGVLIGPKGPTPVVVPYPEVAIVQHRHFVRRRYLGRKKAHDRRVGRMLGGREGRRERARVLQRLHLISKMLVAQAKARRALLVLEELSLPHGSRNRRGRAFRRRLSSWPQRKLHQQIEYKAQEQGVPVLKVDPRYTSKTCPRCGERDTQRRKRMGRVFVCGACGWRCDRQLNAGLNICRTALGDFRTGRMNPALGGLRLDPDALAQDAMRLLYSPGNAGAHERSGRSGRERPGSPPR